ncbi:MAG: hypothetical protein HZA50_14890 [Planctomycetes bacterium]|nr:hypothetical protein [Planctomycetota bacterium]
MKLIATCGIALLLLAGCNPELDQYRNIELGKPLGHPGMLIPATTAPAGAENINLCYDIFVFQLPAIWAEKGMRVMTDADGKVTTKMYFNHALENWFLLKIGFYDYRMEVQIPPECFQDTPAGWEDKSSGSEAIYAMEHVINGLSVGLPEEERKVSGETRHTFREYVYIAEVPINPRRLMTGVLERLTDKNPAPLIDIHKDINLEGLDVARIDAAHPEFRLVRNKGKIYVRAEARLPRDGRHIIGYITAMSGPVSYSESSQYKEKRQQVEKYCTSSDFPPLFSMLNFELAFCVSAHTNWASSPERHINDFHGLTQDGFERVIDFGDGGVAILRNLGDRRIQIEFHFCRVFNPFLLGGWVDYSGHGPTRTEKTSIVRLEK